MAQASGSSAEIWYKIETTNGVTPADTVGGGGSSTLSAAVNPGAVQITVADKSFKILGGDPKRAAKFLVYNLIQDIIGLTDRGERVLYDKKTKEWLYIEFCKSSFLLSNFRSSYELIAGKVSREEKKEEENFSEPSESTSSESMRASKSGSRTKKESTPQTLSEEGSAS